MDTAVVNARVDEALASNKRLEHLTVAMAVGIFVSGMATLTVGYWLRNPYIASGSLLTQVLLVYPIRVIRGLRDQYLVLQTFPNLIAQLGPKEAARLIIELLRGIRRDKL